jgi:hypothetical protein
MDEEIWRPIEAFPNYSVSNYGRVRNEDRGRLVVASHNPQGALKVGLVIGGRQYVRSVKVLVGEAFCGGPVGKHDTPMLLDGDQDNVRADNIVYRPRWFAWKYSRQFEAIERYVNGVGIRDRKTGVEYRDIADAALTNGLLCREILICIPTHGAVFPHWQSFEWIID